jgi:hypothetical protein
MKTIASDFDGTIADSNGWKGASPVIEALLKQTLRRWQKTAPLSWHSPAAPSLSNPSAGPKSAPLTIARIRSTLMEIK